MARRVLARRRFPVLILAVTAACSGGQSAPTTPAAATARESTTAPAAGRSTGPCRRSRATSWP